MLLINIESPYVPLTCVVYTFYYGHLSCYFSYPT